MRILRNKIIFSMFVFMICFSIALAGTRTSANVGKLARDGVRVYITVFDPFYEAYTYNRTNKIEGYEIPVEDGNYIEYRDLFIYFLFPGPTYRNLTFTIFFEYERTYYNETEKREITYYEPDFNETLSLLCAGGSETYYQYKLPDYREKVHIRVIYLNVVYQFYYLTSDLVTENVWYGFQWKVEVFKQIMKTFAIVVVIGVAGAGLLSTKAGIFDLHWTWAFILPLLVLDIFLLYAEYVYQAGLKEAFYRFPIWAVYFMMTTVTLLISINVFNKVKGQKYFVVSKYDTTAVSINSARIPVDKDEKNFLEPGFKASCIRLFSSSKSNRYANSFRIGTFKEIELEESIELKKEGKKQRKIASLEKQGYSFKRKETSLDGTVTLIYTKKDLLFEETDVSPRWFWNPKGYSNFLKEYWVKNMRLTRASINTWSPTWLPAGILCIFNLIFNFFITNNKNATLDASLKISLWVLFTIFFLWAVSYNSQPGYWEIEVLHPHIAFSIVEAQIELARAEKDAETIRKLEDRLIELENKFKVEVVLEADKIATGFIRDFRNVVAWKKPDIEEVLEENAKQNN